MPHITGFEIRGLAGRRKIVRHRLQQDLNVFWGPNGCGKTSLLKILHGALSDEVASLVRVPFTSAIVEISDDRRTDPPTQYTRTINKSDFNDSDAVQLALESDDDGSRLWREERAHMLSKRLPRWRTEPSIESPRLNVFTHGYLPISRISEARRRARARPAAELLDEASFDRLFAGQVQELWQEYNQRALMQIRTAQEFGIAKILTSVLSSNSNARRPALTEMVDPDRAYDLVESFFKSQRLGTFLRLTRKSFAENYGSSQLVQEVVAEVADIQRGIEKAQEPQHQIEELLGSLYGGSKKVSLEGRQVVVTAGKGGEPVPLESLSSGEKQLLQLFLECLAAGRNPVIVDEPELSLHVDWQGKLVGYIQTINDSAQLIMATHSPEVMARLPERTIIEL